VICLYHGCTINIARVKTVAERLRHARLQRGWTQNHLAAAAGVSQGTIGNIESGARQSRGSLPQIAEALGISHKWLADGLGSMTLVSNTAAQYGEPDLLVLRRSRLVLPLTRPGHITEPDDVGVAPVLLHPHWLRQHSLRPEHLVAIRVDGPAMEPSLFDGDTVVLNTDATSAVDGGVFAFDQDGTVILRRLNRDAGQWWMHADHPDQARFPRKSFGEESAVIGQVLLKLSQRI
jgi:phage repressor protein C with HTH and peptisase S24 domain